ncbi:MAG: hypothetical protein ABW000_17295 [Actinoplanes sp.]
MTDWLALYAPLTVPTGIDPVRYLRLPAAQHHVADRITRCFAGPAWLSRRFPARSSVRVDLLTHDDASVSVEHLKPKGWGGGHGGPRQIRCRLRIPASWPAQPGDALLGLRMFQGVLHALHLIGERYDIGTPAAVRPGAGRGDPDLRDPFHPPPPEPSYADINAHLERLAAALHPEQLLLAVRGPTSSTVARQCRGVHEALGEVVDQRTLTAPQMKATAWIIQPPS